MGNSQAYPVFRTADAAEALAQALRLSALLAGRDDEVTLMADLLTVEDARRMAAALPGARLHHAEGRKDPVTGDFLDFDLDVATAEHAALEPELPLSVLHYVPQGTVEERFTRAVGRDMASIGLGGRWPDDPETDSHGSATYDGVEVMFNYADMNWSQPADHHTVFVHVDKSGDLPCAERLAAYLGSTVLGEAQSGW
ncbi:hypothetical protein AB0J81_29285 [Streptomyces bobili]|uniref:hypothetical protein n=1 Tax=Streptomyces bobili TaxID=67280 RepID=UPI00342B2C41